MNMMSRYREIKEERSEVTAELTDIWESSVRATHLFLSEQEIGRIKGYVPQALCDVPRLFVAEKDGVPVAFAGVDGNKLEMLFVSAENRGKGIGKRLLQYAIDVCGVSELTVNEQNPQAVGFYEHMGFRAYKRSETDEQGGRHPVLYMRKACRELGKVDAAIEVVKATGLISAQEVVK